MNAIQTYAAVLAVFELGATLYLASTTKTFRATLMRRYLVSTALLLPVTGRVMGWW